MPSNRREREALTEQIAEALGEQIAEDREALDDRARLAHAQTSASAQRAYLARVYASTIDAAHAEAIAEDRRYHAEDARENVHREAIAEALLIGDAEALASAIEARDASEREASRALACDVIDEALRLAREREDRAEQIERDHCDALDENYERDCEALDAEAYAEAIEAMHVEALDENYERDHAEALGEDALRWLARYHAEQRARVVDYAHGEALAEDAERAALASAIAWSQARACEAYAEQIELAHAEALAEAAQRVVNWINCLHASEIRERDGRLSDADHDSYAHMIDEARARAEAYAEAWRGEALAVALARAEARDAEGVALADRIEREALDADHVEAIAEDVTRDHAIACARIVAEGVAREARAALDALDAEAIASEILAEGVARIDEAHGEALAYHAERDRVIASARALIAEAIEAAHGEAHAENMTRFYAREAARAEAIEGDHAEACAIAEALNRCILAGDAEAYARVRRSTRAEGFGIEGDHACALAVAEALAEGVSMGVALSYAEGVARASILGAINAEALDEARSEARAWLDGHALAEGDRARAILALDEARAQYENAMGGACDDPPATPGCAALAHGGACAYVCEAHASGATYAESCPDRLEALAIEASASALGNLGEQFKRRRWQVTVPGGTLTPDQISGVADHLEHAITQAKPDADSWAIVETVRAILALAGDLWLIAKGTYAGTYPKRLASILRRAFPLYDAPSVRQAIALLGSRLGPEVNSGRAYIADLTYRLDWYRGAYGDAKSCFWSTNSGAKQYLMDAGIGALRVYSAWQEDCGIARAWLAAFDGSDRIALTDAHRYASVHFVLFNAYGLPGVVLARVLAEALAGYTYTKVSLCNDGEDADGLIYLNGDAFCVHPIGEDARAEYDIAIDVDDARCEECGSRSCEECENCNERACVCGYCDECDSTRCECRACTHCGEHDICGHCDRCDSCGRRN